MKKRMILQLLVAVFSLIAAQALIAAGKGEPVSTAQPAAEEPVELTFMLNADSTASVDENSPMTKVLKEKVGIVPRISFVGSDYFAKLSVLVASDETPDVFFHGGIGGQTTYEQYIKFIKEGLIIPISDYASPYPNLEKRLQAFEELKAPQYGKLYALPIMNSTKIKSTVANPHTIWYRKDWLDKLGLPIPTNTDEMYTVLKAFTTQDPDGNGSNDTYGYTSMAPGLWWFYPIFNAFGSDIQRFEKKDGKWTPMNLNEGAKAALVWFNRLYKEGILDPEFMITPWDKMIEKFVTGKAGAFMANSGDWYNVLYNPFKQVYPDKDPKTMFTWSSGLRNAKGVKVVNGFPNYWSMTCISAKSSEQKRTKALEFLDYGLSDEGHTFLTYGVEGVNYEVKGGSKVNLNPIGTDGNPKPLSEVDLVAELKKFIQWDVGVMPEGTPNKKECDESAYVWSEGAKADPLAYLFIDPAILDPSVVGSLWDITQTTWTKIIVESTNVSQDFDQYVKAWLVKGGQKYIEEMNKAATAQGL